MPLALQLRVADRSRLFIRRCSSCATGKVRCERLCGDSAGDDCFLSESRPGNQQLTKPAMR
jgi:hypothetical protein